MNRIQPALLFLCLALVAITGCRGGVQVYNVKDAPVMTATGNSPSLEEVQKAIISAGAGLNWSMVVAKPGHIVGTLNIRSHTAVVDIMHNTKTYSITYKDSTNLRYNASNQTIHEQYRAWVQDLDNAIRSRLMTGGK